MDKDRKVIVCNWCPTKHQIGCYIKTDQGWMRHKCSHCETFPSIRPKQCLKLDGGEFETSHGMCLKAYHNVMGDYE